MPFPPTACMRSATLAFMQNTGTGKNFPDFLSNHGIVTTDNARAIYETIIDSPGSYLPYTIGYLEICRIRDTFQKAAGKYYSPLLFHTFLLDTGPTSFPVLERQINGWLKEKTRNSRCSMIY